MKRRTFDTELDCPWMTIDVRITYQWYEEMGLIELESVEVIGFMGLLPSTKKVNMTEWFNYNYIMDLIEDDMEERA
tara:strand:+ start:5451 stop:5678 length:228 start_codon:yes stop_codon:yes gene_type:complete